MALLPREFSINRSGEPINPDLTRTSILPPRFAVSAATVRQFVWAVLIDRESSPSGKDAVATGNSGVVELRRAWEIEVEIGTTMTDHDVAGRFVRLACAIRSM